MLMTAKGNPMRFSTQSEDEVLTDLGRWPNRDLIGERVPVAAEGARGPSHDGNPYLRSLKTGLSGRLNVAKLSRAALDMGSYSLQFKLQFNH